MTPAEVHLFIEANAEKELILGKEAWRRAGFLAAQMFNASGRRKIPLKSKDFIRFEDEKPPKLTPDELAERRRQAIETLNEHKAKFWALIKDSSVKKINEGK